MLGQPTLKGKHESQEVQKTGGRQDLPQGSFLKYLLLESDALIFKFVLTRNLRVNVDSGFSLCLPFFICFCTCVLVEIIENQVTVLAIL